jgi:hypothetical protein
MFASVPAAPMVWWRSALDDFKQELEWLHRGDQLLSTWPCRRSSSWRWVSTAMMIVASRPAFNLPFRTLKDVTETRDLLARSP